MILVLVILLPLVIIIIIGIVVTIERGHMHRKGSAVAGQSHTLYYTPQIGGGSRAPMLSSTATMRWSGHSATGGSSSPRTTAGKFMSAPTSARMRMAASSPLQHARVYVRTHIPRWAGTDAVST
eukprot:COSAG01_NODE_7115_length_3344_cov_1.861325_1_plen_124_part_00